MDVLIDYLDRHLSIANYWYTSDFSRPSVNVYAYAVDLDNPSIDREPHDLEIVSRPKNELCNTTSILSSPPSVNVYAHAADLHDDLR